MFKREVAKSTGLGCPGEVGVRVEGEVELGRMEQRHGSQVQIGM